jgi:hypothetical protein
LFFTDSDGRFSIQKIKAGQYSLKLKDYLAKFESGTVNINSSTSLVFELKLSTSNNKPPIAAVLVSPADNA